MYINGQLIDSVLIQPGQLRQFTVLKGRLEEKHQKILERLTDNEPEYFVEGIPSRSNPEPPAGPPKVITWN